MAGGSWCSDPLDARLLHLHEGLCNVLRMPQSVPSLKEGLERWVIAQYYLQEALLLPSNWCQLFGRCLLRRDAAGLTAESGLEAKLRTPELVQRDGAVMSWAGSTPERKEPETGCTYSRAVSITVHLPAAGCGKPVFYSHKKLDSKWPVYKAVYRLNVCTRQIW